MTLARSSQNWRFENEGRHLAMLFAQGDRQAGKVILAPGVEVMHAVCMVGYKHQTRLSAWRSRAQ